MLPDVDSRNPVVLSRRNDKAAAFANDVGDETAARIIILTYLYDSSSPRQAAILMSRAFHVAGCKQPQTVADSRRHDQARGLANEVSDDTAASIIILAYYAVALASV